MNAAGRTDGRLAVAKLRAPSDRPAIEYDSPNTKVPTAKRFVRRTTLEARQYLLRENVYYLGYLLVRKAVHGHVAATAEQAAKSDTDAQSLF